jgi:hypothetical protein
MSKARKGFSDPAFRDDDPMTGVANLFDIGLVFIVGLLLTLFSAYRLQDLFDRNSEMTIMKQQANGEMELSSKKAPDQGHPGHPGDRRRQGQQARRRLPPGRRLHGLCSGSLPTHNPQIKESPDARSARTSLSFPLLLRTITCFGLCCSALILAPPLVQAAHDHGATGHSADPAMLETMVVTADRLGEYAENNPAMVEVMGEKKLKTATCSAWRKPWAAWPGGGQTIHGRGFAHLHSRVRKIAGVLVLLNGRPLNSNQYGSVDLAGIPIETIESITVFKPPVPVWLGSGASEGAISIVTKGISGKKKASKRHVSKLRGTVGSYGTFEASASHQLQLDSGATAMGSATGKHRDGKRANKDLDSGSFLVRWNGELAENRQVEIMAVTSPRNPVHRDRPTTRPGCAPVLRQASFDSRLSGLAGATGDYVLNLYGDTIEVEDKSQSGMISTWMTTSGAQGGIQLE